MRRLKRIITLSLFFLFAGCAQTESKAESTDRLKVVATTTMLTDLVNEIGGDAVEVEGLMGPGIDPHGYQPTPSDVMKLSEADIVAYNGLNLEGKLGDVFEKLMEQNKTLFVLEEALPKTQLIQEEDSSATIDPHIWFSVTNWQLAADYITRELSKHNPDYKSVFEANNEQYQAELAELDTYIKERVASLPEDQRYLVTAHDAFGYFGVEYGFEVVGLQGINTQTEAGTGDVSALADFIAANEIKAVFVESSVPTKTIESLKDAVQNKGWEVKIGGELFSDALGDPSQDAETYIKMYRYNIDTIIDALK